MKKIVAIILMLSMFILAVGCGKKEESIKIGLVTDAGTIDDKSFNQNAWEGIQKGVSELGVQAKYLQPKSKTTADYLVEIENLISADYDLIITTGYMFQEAITIAQKKYPEKTFVLIDAAPESISENVQAILFAENEAGFIAGMIAALESKSGKLGFIGGMEIPPVQKFGWGFIAGVAYANKEFNLNAEVIDYIYEGSFDNVAGGSALAAGMFDNGVDIIFTAAGGVGIGAISEAKTRAKNGESVYVIGVDRDQFEDGIMENGKSVILTSALKRVDNAAYYAIKDFVDKKFEGGKQIVLDASNEGVGFPKENPNVKGENFEKVSNTMKKLKDTNKSIPSSKEEVTKLLEEMNAKFENIKY